MDRWVEIAFDCIPLRSIGRLDAPLDASPKFRERCLRIKAALDKHGSHNAYYLCNAHCVYRLTNQDDVGLIEFQFEGVALTDAADEKCQTCDLQVWLDHETCSWLTEPIVKWFEETVSHSVAVEFDRYIAAGDLEKTKKRIDAIQEQSDQAGGFVGMYL